MKVAVIDIETSGGKFNCPIQVAYRVYASEAAFLQGSDTGRTSFYILPDDEILPCTTALHGMTRGDLVASNATELQHCSSLLAKMWQDLDGCLVVGYNVKEFDLPVLQEASTRAGVKPYVNWAAFDVYDFARRTQPLEKIGNFKMDSVYVYLFPDRLDWLWENRAAHDAAQDCEVVRIVLIELLSRKRTDMTAAFFFMDTPQKVETFSFGKYKGKPIAEVAADHGYCQWLSQQEWFARQWPDLCYSICVSGKDEVAIGPQVIAAIRAARGVARLPISEPTSVKVADLPQHVTETVRRSDTASFDVGLGDVSQVLEEVKTTDKEFFDSFIGELPF